MAKFVPPRNFCLLPSAFLLCSGRLVSRTAGQTEANEAEAVVREVVVFAIGDDAVVRIAAPAAAADAFAPRPVAKIILAPLFNVGSLFPLLQVATFT
jgi:hypothetical protein